MFTSPPSLASKWSSSVPDPDLEIGGGGGGRSLKKIFWSKNKGGKAPRGPSPRSATEVAKFCTQLFRERLSEKVRATIPKGIMGGFGFSVLRRILKQWHERPWT